MGTGAGLLARARKHVGEKYENVQVPKDDPNWHGPWDCAEFMSWLVYQEAGILYGCEDDQSAPAKADAYTGAWERDSKSLGTRISIEDAAGTVGAILLRYPPGPGKMGHIVLSDGAGGTVEAKGKAFGVVAGTVHDRNWDTGVLVPGITYDNATAKPLNVEPPSILYAMGMPNMSKAIVSAIQQKLADRNFYTDTIDGLFGKGTALAVAKFQDSLGLVADGQVGRETASALGILLPGMTPDLVGSVLEGRAMNPLIGVALSVLPEIFRALTGDRKTAEEQIVQAVTDVTKTADPQQAKQTIQTDPAAFTALQLKLAEIAAAQEEKRQTAQLELIKEQYKEDASKRDDLFRQMQANLQDTQDARNTFKNLAQLHSPMAWFPFVVSIIVLIGFFTILIILLFNGIPKDVQNRDQVVQIINIIIGALAAGFATVLSFWLGSSQGSRAKDVSAIAVQTQQAQQTSEILKTQAQQTDTVLKSAVQDSKRPAQVGKAGVSNFQRCVDLVLRQEGEFTDDRRDPGGPTNLGITLAEFRSWRHDDSLTADDIKQIKKEEACEIYRTQYWNVLNCDNLPVGVDLVVFDHGVNAGPSRSAKILQTVVGAEADGSIGPATLGALKAMSPQDIVTRMSQKRLEFYQSLAKFDVFGRGWTNRTRAIEDAALDMIRGGAASS